MHKKETKDQFKQLRTAGHSLNAISQQLNVPRSTINDWNKDLAPTIHAEHRYSVQDTLEALNASKPERIEALAICFKQLEKQVRKAKNPLRITRLYELLLKYDQYMNNQLLHEGNPISAQEAEENKKPPVWKNFIPRPWDKCTCNVGRRDDCYFHSDEANKEKEEALHEIEVQRRRLRELEAEFSDGPFNNSDNDDDTDTDTNANNTEDDDNNDNAND